MTPLPLSVQLAPLRQQLDDDLTAVAALPAVRRRQPILDALRADLDGALEQEDGGAVVCLVGSTGAGKSTLINALAGRVIARSGVSRPTTTLPTIYVPDDADPSRVAALQGDGGLGGVEVVTYTPDDTAPWAGQIFIDAPDVNSVADVHRDRVAAMVAASDVLLVVMHRQSITERSPVSFLDDWHDRRRMIFVLNRSDELLPEAQQALSAQVRHLAANRWELPGAPVFTVSAQQALADRRWGGLPPLVTALESLAEDTEIQKVRRHRVLGVVARISAEAQQVLDGLAEDLDGLPGDLAKGLSVVQGQLLADSDRRLAARQVDVAAQFTDEVGRRWAGPGGYLIRAGGLTGVGAAVGALVTRQTMVGGAAIAGASALADQGTRQLRQWRVEAGTDLLPTHSDLRQWTAQALVGTQARLKRIGLPAPEAIVPAAITDRTLEALGDTWRGVVHRDLPEAAARAAHLALRLLLDLPIWGAVFWIVYRVADGYIAEQHEGLPFLVDTAILVGAYAIVERTVVLLWLRWQARRLSGDIQRQLTDRLSETHAAVVEDARLAAESWRAPLRSLAGAAGAWREAVALHQR